MKITVVGAGAMGASYGGHLARAGHEVALLDTWQDHVDAINRDGLRVDGVLGDHRIKVPASAAPDGAGLARDADVAIVFVDANNTARAAEILAGLLAPDGFAITFQNGIGNVEKLQAALGPSACSAALPCAVPRPADPATSRSPTWAPRRSARRMDRTARACRRCWTRCAAPASRSSTSPT